eukprot:2730619-Amphidinium_carterae.1
MQFAECVHRLALLWLERLVAPLERLTAPLSVLPAQGRHGKRSFLLKFLLRFEVLQARALPAKRVGKHLHDQLVAHTFTHKV